MTATTSAQIDNDVYDRLADTWWDENGPLTILKGAVNPWRLPYFQRILTHLQIDPSGKRALDVGCGGGFLSEEFAAMGFSVTGLDPSDKSLEAARVHAAQNGLQIDYRLGYGDALPFADETFEVIYCCDVLEHISNWDEVIGEIARVLKPRGLFFYDTVNRTLYSKVIIIKVMQEWRFTRFFPPNVHVWEMFIKPAELKASIQRHGLQNQDVRGTKLSANPLQMLTVLRAMRQYKLGQITADELGQRVGLEEGPSTAASYMGYAMK